VTDPGRQDADGAPLPTLRAVLARGHFRLVVLAVVLAAVSLTITGALLLRSYAQQNLHLAAKTLSYAVEPAVYFGDPEAVHEAIRSVGAQETIRRIEVSGKSNGLMVSWEPESGRPESALERWVGELVWPATVEAPIYNQSKEVIGKIEIFGSARGPLSYSVVGLIIGLGCLGLTILATRMLARKLEEDVVRPLVHVAEVAAAVRNDREFSRRTAPCNIAEVDRFSSDFNGLLAELEGWHNSFVSENEALAHMADHDTMTGLGNRALFERELIRAIERSDATKQPFALLYIDIDHFKLINDTCGHAGGDAVLKEMAARLQAGLRAHDQAFRLGGDEFAVLVDAPGSETSLESIRARLLEAMAPPAALDDGEEIRILVSVGIATYPRDARDAQTLVRRADQDMYSAKGKRNLRAIWRDEGASLPDRRAGHGGERADRPPP
jgi:diguanylate cyclase (GGDEF)-like protein